MDTEHMRPDPDTLLAHLQEEDARSTQGRLKIFLGYAAGVGKTFAMLEAAHQRKAEGIDVVIGYVETHKRIETERMAQQLETIPRKLIEYHGVQLSEMDLEAILSRHPQLVLIDELAHTNVPGSLHPKRYQDVQDLLAAGINVYTTLNIQHLESLNDVVAQITGIHVHETVPDSVIDEAAEIELVDLPPEELLNRLQEGKVYIPEQAARAIHKFFRTGNLTALRELAMRRAAERVDDQMSGYMQLRSIPGPWPATERLLVCVSPGSLGETLVRSARRLADELNAPWTAVYVETPDSVHMRQEERDRISATLRLSEELGAHPVILPGARIAETIIAYARQQNVTKIIAGKTITNSWAARLRKPVIEDLIDNSGNIDVYVISSEHKPAAATPAERAWQPHRPLRRYFYALLLTALAVGASDILHLSISPVNLVMIYLLAIVIAALYLGRGPSILVSIISLLCFDFFFVPPYFTFAVSDTEYILTFAGFLAVGLVISQLTSVVREQVEMVRRREMNMALLYSLSHDLASAGRLDEVIEAVKTNMEQNLGREITIFLPEQGNAMKLKPYNASKELKADSNEMAVALWAYQHGQAAGRGTDNLPAQEARYIPLKTSHGIVGVISVRPTDPTIYLTPEQIRLLEAMVGQAALAIERTQLAENARQAQLYQATEKLQTALLNSISHDLRTPLVTVTGALNTIREDCDHLKPAARNELLDTAISEADRLNRLVGNLLQMTRLEAGGLKLNKQPSDIQDAIGSALEQLDKQIGSREIHVNVPDAIPMLSFDFVLMVQVFYNVIDNALKYSPADSPIDIQAGLSGAFLEVQVADRGSGIPQADLPRVFDKFYRVERPENVVGTGLGLSICKGILEAHGGYIAAEQRPGGGTIITIALPV